MSYASELLLLYKSYFPPHPPHLLHKTLLLVFYFLQFDNDVSRCGFLFYWFSLEFSELLKSEILGEVSKHIWKILIFKKKLMPFFSFPLKTNWLCIRPTYWIFCFSLSHSNIHLLNLFCFCFSVLEFLSSYSSTVCGKDSCFSFGLLLLLCLNSLVGCACWPLLGLFRWPVCLFVHQFRAVLITVVQ